MKGQSHAHMGDFGQAADLLSRQQKFLQQSLGSFSQLDIVFGLSATQPRFLWKTSLKKEVFTRHEAQAITLNVSEGLGKQNLYIS